MKKWLTEWLALLSKENVRYNNNSKNMIYILNSRDMNHWIALVESVVIYKYKWGEGQIGPLRVPERGLKSEQ